MIALCQLQHSPREAYWLMAEAISAEKRSVSTEKSTQVYRGWTVRLGRVSFVCTEGSLILFSKEKTLRGGWLTRTPSS